MCMAAAAVIVKHQMCPVCLALEQVAQTTVHPRGETIVNRVRWGPSRQLGVSQGRERGGGRQSHGMPRYVIPCK